MVASAAVYGRDGELQEHSRSERVVVPPLELYGKSSAFVAAGLRKGLLLPFANTDALKAIADKVGATVLTFLGDAASSNRRVLKHIVGMQLRDHWPDNLLIDAGQVCMLHQIHRIKTSLVDVHTTVSMMYCLSQLVRAGSVMPLVADFIADFVAQNCRRILGPPPADGAATARRILDMLYKLDAPHHILHGSRGDKKSKLVMDIEALLAMDNGGFAHPAGHLVHYCWSSSGQPCCADHEQTVEKMTASYLNMFVAHAVPVATLSRWTHITTVCVMLCTSYACRDIFIHALKRGMTVDERAEETAEQQLAAFAAGAGDADVATEHRARTMKVKQWFDKQETTGQVASLYLMLQEVDGVTYYLMGGERSEGRHKRPGTVPQADQALPAREFTQQVRKALVGLADLLQMYGEGGSSCNFFLKHLGLADSDLASESLMRTFRRHMVGASTGLFRRLGLRLQTFPVKLWVLVEPGVDPSHRREVAEEFLALLPCCAGIFGKSLQALCPTVESLLSLRGRGIIKGWLNTLHWTIYACEKEHASCRRLVHSDGPGRQWSLVARERVMESIRTLHLQRTSNDPAAPPPARGTKRPSPESGEALALNPSPLQTQGAPAIQAVLPWPEQSVAGAIQQAVPAAQRQAAPAADGAPPMAAPGAQESDQGARQQVGLANARRGRPQALDLGVRLWGDGSSPS